MKKTHHIVYTANQIGEIVARQAAIDAGIPAGVGWSANITTTVHPTEGLTRISVRIEEKA